MSKGFVTEEFLKGCAPGSVIKILEDLERDREREVRALVETCNQITMAKADLYRRDAEKYQQSRLQAPIIKE